MLQAPEGFSNPSFKRCSEVASMGSKLFPLILLPLLSINSDNLHKRLNKSAGSLRR